MEDGVSEWHGQNLAPARAPSPQAFVVSVKMGPSDFYRRALPGEVLGMGRGAWRRGLRVWEEPRRAVAEQLRCTPALNHTGGP